MFERIIEIIVFVIAELQSKKNITDVDLKQLQNLGYTNTEISTAFSWLADKFEIADDFDGESITQKSSIRILHSTEQELFTKEAYRELIQMQTLRMISNEQIELLIERGMYSGGELIDTRRLKQFVAHSVFSDVMQSVYGSRIMLNGTDSIN